MAEPTKGAIKRDNKTTQHRPRTHRGIGEVSGRGRLGRIDEMLERMQRGQSTDSAN